MDLCCMCAAAVLCPECNYTWYMRDESHVLDLSVLDVTVLLLKWVVAILLCSPASTLHPQVIYMYMYMYAIAFFAFSAGLNGLQVDYVDRKKMINEVLLTLLAACTTHVQYPRCDMTIHVHATPTQLLCESQKRTHEHEAT